MNHKLKFDYCINNDFLIGSSQKNMNIQRTENRKSILLVAQESNNNNDTNNQRCIYSKPINHFNNFGSVKQAKKSENLEDLTEKLEQTLFKLLKSFDPKKIKNEDLKFIILKEIVQCQLNLMSMSEDKNVKKKQTPIPMIFMMNGKLLR